MVPVLLFSRAVISKFSRDDRTTEITFRRWELPPTRRTSPLQLLSEAAFAVAFYTSYLNVCQKGLPRYLWLIKKMGSHQKVMKAFLDAACDDVMLDRWIPDEDWVRQMRLNCGEEVLMDDTLQQSTMTIRAPFSVRRCHRSWFPLSSADSGPSQYTTLRTYVVSEVWEFAPVRSLLVIYIYIRY